MIIKQQQHIQQIRHELIRFVPFLIVVLNDQSIRRFPSIFGSLSKKDPAGRHSIADRESCLRNGRLCHVLPLFIQVIRYCCPWITRLQLAQFCIGIHWHNVGFMRGYRVEEFWTFDVQILNVSNVTLKDQKSEGLKFTPMSWPRYGCLESPRDPHLVR